MSTLEKLEFDKISAHTETLCLSDMGREKISQALPFLSLRAVFNEMQKTAELKRLFESAEELPISHFPDTRSIYRKLSIADTFLQPKELLSTGHALRLASQLKKFFFNRKDIYPELTLLTEGLWMEKSLQHEISRAIDDTGEIRDNASDALLDIRSRLGQRRIALRRKYETLLRRYTEKSMLMEDSVTIRNGRLVLGFRVEHKYSIQGFIHDISQSGQTVFIEPAETLTLSNEIRELEIEEGREIERILRAVSSHLRGYLEPLLLSQELLAQFDALYGKAKLALEIKGVLPNFDPSLPFSLRNAYHPWLFLHHRRSGKAIEPLTVSLGLNQRILIITGPNAGGKSVALKTLGLISEMARRGYLIPCREDSNLILFDEIFVEIGDEQSIDNDLSTFSSHLKNLKSILDTASSQSLVLIDEICSGTDPEEGAAIAIGILEALRQRGTLTAVSTHQGTLKAYAHQREGVINGSMQFDAEELRPTYRFQLGIPGSSFALEMARRMGFGPELLKSAEHALGESKHALEEFISTLNREVQALRSEKEKVQTELAETLRIKETVETQRADLQRERKALRQSALAEGKRVLAEANAKIEKAIFDIKRSNGDAEVIKHSRKGIEVMRKEVAALDQDTISAAPLPTDVTFREGDKVRLSDTQAVGEIADVHDEDAIVLIGNFRLKTSLRNLEKISSKEARAAERKESIPAAKGLGGSGYYGITDFSSRLDLRGLTGDEALTKVARFIDDAIRHKLLSIDIVHGKGTGSLRKRVNDYLKQDERIKSFRLGNWNEGGTGATIVELHSYDS